MVSWLLPRHLHQHFYNVYAYCRWADDLGDEVPDRARALELLDAWEDELRLCYFHGQNPSHPVLIALRETIRAKDIPDQPFSDLLRAFRQDQRVQRYPTWDDVLDYCVYSANPVGRWCSTSAAIATRSGSGFPIPPARRCSSRISGRMCRAIWKKAASTFRSMRWLRMD